MTDQKNLPEEAWDALSRGGFFDLPADALARLAISDLARQLSDSARGLVHTYSDRYIHSGEMAESAKHLVSLAQELLDRAVIWERERNRSWEVIGDSLGVTRQTAHERWAEKIEEWERTLNRPGEPLHGPTITWSSNLPDGLTDANDTLQYLDKWVSAHAEPSDVVAGVENPVSGNIVDENSLALGLGKAATSAMSALTSKPIDVHDPIIERTMYERKLRVMERLAHEKPDDHDARIAAQEARETLATLKKASSAKQN